MSSEVSSDNPIYGPFFGVMGAASAIIFSGKLEPNRELELDSDASHAVKNRTLCGVKGRRGRLQKPVVTV